VSKLHQIEENAVEAAHARGALYPITSAVATNSVEDDDFYIVDGTDNTKRVAFSVGGLTTATDRTITVGDGSGLLPAYQIARVDSATALVGDTSEQAMFASAGDALTVVAATTYRFRCVAQLTTGATAVTVAFSLNGDATFTTSFGVSLGVDAASGTAAAAFMNNSVALGTAFVVCASGTGVNKRFIVEGEFEVNAGGTVIPSVTFSADPQGTETVNVGSFFECWAIGAAPVTAIGGWA
jgi:hypothetical protein